MIRNSPPSCTKSSVCISIRRAHAVALSIDERSQIQALDRTQPGLPMKKGAAHHDTRLQATRHNHTIRCAERAGRQGDRPLHERHRHKEFILFLNAIEAGVPAGKVIHAVVDNYATHEHPKVGAWLVRHPRWVSHFTPTSASWPNVVEGFFDKLTNRRLKRGLFRSIVELQTAINRFLTEANDNPRSFQWTKDPDRR